MRIKNIEHFFLNALLQICMGGLLLVLFSNLLFFPEDKLSISITIAILLACSASYFVRKKYPTLAVIIVTTVALAAMGYQRLTVPNTSTTLSVVLIVGFIFSIMLRGKIMWIMHGIAFTIINTIFIYHLSDAITAAITYSTLYFILTFATGMLKAGYDRIYEHLENSNQELVQKAQEIEHQNMKLLAIQEDLNSLNTGLEKIVDERTTKIIAQNEILYKYSYANAHHLRGPVARLLGLASIYKADPKIEATFIIDKMEEQAHEIDAVVKQINIDLESN